MTEVIRNFCGEVKRGMWVHQSLYNIGMGVIVETMNCNTGGYSSEIDGVTVSRKGGSVKIVSIESQKSITDYPEELLRSGMQCGVLFEQPELASDQQIAVFVAEAIAQQKTFEEDRKQKQSKFEQAVEDLKNSPEFAYLEQLEKYRYSKDVAKNIRKALKKHFNGHKFGVKCDGYNSIDVTIPETVDSEKVKQIINQFNADGNTTPFNTVFGGVEYIFYY